MKKILILGLVASFNLFQIGASYAAESGANRAKTLELLKMMGAEEQAEQMQQLLVDSFKQQGIGDEAFWTKFSNKLNSARYLEMVAPVYERHLSPADMDGLIKFFTSPTGKKWVEASPQIQMESYQVGQMRGQEIAEEIEKELAAKKSKAAPAKK